MSVFSEKQLSAYNDSTARLNIFTGAVRSGKSFVALLRFIKYIRDGDIKGDLLIVGKSMQTIKRNIISPLQDLVGNKCRYKIGLGEIQLFGRRIHVVSGNDERSEGKLRGSEFAGALVDEATILPESFFQMMLSRLSIEGAQCFVTTNPDNPNHWLKKNFIDRSDEIGCKVFSFQLQDNPSLSESYKQALRQEFTGLWYKRFVEGLWVSGEGSVFSFFDPDVHVIDYPISQANKYFIGCDYGISNPTSYILVGYNSSASPSMWVEKEYCFDSRKQMYQKSDYELVEDYKQFIEGLYIDKIFVDPSASSLKQEFRRQGVYNVYDANNDVLDGIQTLSQVIMNGTLKICSNCEVLIKEISGYTWDPRASINGIDKPIKRGDHQLDGLRYIIHTEFGNSMGSTMKESDALDMERAWYRPIATMGQRY
jgi:PBSX family phage terminase large subunit